MIKTPDMKIPLKKLGLVKRVHMGYVLWIAGPRIVNLVLKEWSLRIQMAIATGKLK